MVVIGLSTQMLVLYIDKAKVNPFSFAVTMPFALVIFAVTWFARIWVDKINLLIEINAERFMNDLSTYSYSLGVVMIWVGVGLLLGIASIIFEILDSESRKQQELKLETRQMFEQGISLYQRKKFDKAIDCFDNVLVINVADAAAALYVKRCQYFRQHGTPEGWEGVTAMYEK